MHAIIGVGLAGALCSAATAQMRITEYMYSGGGDEYIEFTNVGVDPIDMTGWSYDDDSQTPGTEDLSGFGIVQPGQSVVMTEGDAAQFRADWGLDESCVIVGGIKANIGRNDQINLYDATATVVDTLTYGDEDFPGSVRTQNVSGWVQAYGIGLDDAYSVVLSREGDVQGSWLSGNADVGSPCAHALVNNVILNEIRIDQPSSDTDEYVELRGEAGIALDGLTLIVLGDGTGGSGVIEAVVALSGVIPADGHFLVVEDTHTIAPAVEQDLVADLNFENSDNVTFILVGGFTGALGDDLDADDDCSLDSTPWAVEYDRLALVEEENPPASTECHYGPPALGPDGTFVPGHAFRCDPTTEWAIGAFDPVGGMDTPGTPNAACPALECSEKELRINEARADQPSSDDDEYIEIAGAPGTSLDGVCLIILGDDGNDDLCGWVDGVIDLTGHVIPADGYFLIAEDDDTFGETADLVTAIEFENNDNLTLLLVCDCQNVAADLDLDADDDGTLDSTPWAFMYDSVAFFGTEGVECTYASALADGGADVPAHILRCLDGMTWGTGAEDPKLSVDTPGLPNADCPIDECFGDLDDSGDVGFNDLVTLLAAWGPCAGCPADLDGSGEVDFTDLVDLLANWGPC